MGTPFKVIYDAFRSMILDDEWADWDEELVEIDMRAILENAIPFFKFPRIPLDRTDEGFVNSLTNNEIKILANYMKIEWLSRCILTWQNLKPLYAEADFSQANLIDKFTKLLEKQKIYARDLESIYYRSMNGAPYPYRNLARQ